MIALFGHDEYSVLGLASILEIEKIPYRRVAQPAANGGLLLAVGPTLSSDETAAVQHQPALILNGGTSFAREVFGARDPSVEDTACTISLTEPVWSASVRQAASDFDKSALLIPLAPACASAGFAKGINVASVRPLPATGRRLDIVRANECLWSPVDLGAAFASLLTERYAPVRGRAATAPVWTARVRRIIEAAYYAAPDIVRRGVQRMCYANLARTLRSDAPWTSEYPIDATGWLLIELVKALIKAAAGTLIRLERWPAPYQAAAVLTHDIEPRRYAYGAGLRRLLGSAGSLPVPRALGLVAAASARYLTDDSITRLQPHEIFCHGLDHRGENVHGRAQVATSLRTARSWLERRVGRQIQGYRSPRLDRSADLIWALDHERFAYDSSYPDVDRENLAHFGAGVRVNVPYRPLVEEERGLRFSRCLELPVTAPDCIQPLFAGETPTMLRAAVEAKAAFLRATGGVYVAIVHGGVFGRRDAERREEHFRHVAACLSHPRVWFASIPDLVGWWRGRAALKLDITASEVCIINPTDQRITGLQLIIEDLDAETTLAVPSLDPGMSTALALPVRIPRPAA